MRRDLLITALIFTVVGFVGGSLYSRYATEGPVRSPLPQPATAEAEPVLPEGHPPLDIAQQWNTLREQAEANPRDLKAATELANFLYDIEHWEDAVFWYRRALELAPNDTDVRTDLATCYYNMGRFDEAIDVYTQALQLDPNKPQALYGLAMARLRGKRDVAGARQAYQQLRRSHPDFPGLDLLAKELGEGRPRS